MEKVRSGLIGFGCRAYGMNEILLGFDDVEIVAVCDKYEDRVENAKKRVLARRIQVDQSLLISFTGNDHLRNVCGKIGKADSAKLGNSHPAIQKKSENGKISFFIFTAEFLYGLKEFSAFVF